MRKKCALILSLSLTIAALGRSAEPFTCTGKVADYRARPVGGAEVLCHETFYEYERGQRRREILGRARTNDEGRFSLEIRATERDHVWVGARAQGLSLGWQAATRDKAELDFTIQLGEPAVLAGMVVDESSIGIAGAKVRIYLRNEPAGGRSSIAFGVPEDWYTTQTDARGRFSFDNIPAGTTADFWVEAPGKVCRWTFWDTDSSPGMQFEAGRNDIRIVLGPEARILGHIIDEDTGSPVGGIQVLARPDKGWANYYCADLVVSDSRGKFCFAGMPAGTYSFQVVPPREKMADWVGKDVKVAVKSGQTVRDVEVPVSKGTILELVVHDAQSNQPVEGVSVTVSQNANYGRHPCYWKSVVTDDRGRVRFRVPAGECRVMAGGQDYAYDRDIEPITVASGKVTKREIQLTRNPRVSGIVRDQDGRPAAGVAVTSKPVCNQTVRTDANGRFEVSWYARSSIRKTFLLAQDLRRNLAGLVEFTDESQPVDIQLGPAFTLEGRVTGPNGKGVARAAVSLRASLPGWITNVGERVFTDDKGFYQIGAVPPPQPDFSYSLEVNAKDYGPLRLREVSFGDDPAKPVEIDTIVLPLADQSISGVVVDSENVPAAGIRITLSGPRGSRTAGQPERRTVTDEKGRFLINRVCKGPLRIQAGYSSDPKGAGFLDAQGGAKDVKIVLGQEGVHKPYVSLVGKALPELKVFGTNLPVADTKGKALLICFFDMEQRPSRHWITQLVKKAEQLEEKEIAVVAIQASKLDTNTLHNWVKKNEIPFAIGMIQRDAEKARFAWGVKSLPWLILTNKEHIVRAEGLRLDELDIEIKKANK